MRPSRPWAAALATCLLGSVLSGTAVPAVPAAAGQEAVRGGCTGLVALTFDDGPRDGPTGRLLGLLRDADAPATFFMVGQRVAADPRLARRVERAGFLVANHSWAHQDMRTQSAAEVEASLRATDRALRRAGTHPTRLMRPPYGALDDAARTGIRRAGMVPVLWSVDSRDWAGGTRSEIAARILAGLRPGGNVVLQHDGVGHSPVSVEAVPTVVREARRRGYCFTALDGSGRPGFPTPAVSVTATGGAEGGAALATVRLSAPPGRDTSVLLRTRTRTARVGEDVPRVARRVTIPAGRLEARVRVPLLRDGTDEPAEELAVVLARPRGLRLGAAVATARIADRDRPPVLRGVDVAVAEPATGTRTVTAVLSLSRPSGRPVRLVLAAQPGTADPSDYDAARVVVDLPPGRTVARFPVTVLADALDEPPETLQVVVVRALHARAGRPATVTIAPPQPGPGTR